jgi:cell division protein FtsW (lipid II flippase)
MFEQSVIRMLATRLPLGILLPMFALASIGIVNLASAAQATRPDLYLAQLSKFAFAISLMIVTALIHTRVIRRIAFIAFAAAIVLLALVLVVGTTAKGGQRWLVFGAMRLQPSDPAKIALVLALARYCSLYWPQDGYSLWSLCRPLNISRPLAFLLSIALLLLKAKDSSYFFSDQFLTSHKGMLAMASLLLIGLSWLVLALIDLFRQGFSLPIVVAPIDIALLPFVLVAIEPDLGTGVLTLGIAAIMFLFVGIRKYSLILGTACALAVASGAYFTLLKDYQRQRIITFLSPESDAQGHGYHAMQSIIAIGSGGLSGKGFSGGTQTQLSFLPENATDFVFSVWAEEWGFFACFILLLICFLWLWSIVKMALKTDDPFSQLICIGVAADIFLHVFINIGMVTGILPVVGVPLPLLSYGGSSLTTTLVGIGLVLNVALWRGAK